MRGFFGKRRLNMRLWKKIRILDARIDTPRFENKVYEDFSKEMGGYDVDDSYQSKESFLNKYFQTRYVIWDTYLRRNLHKDDEILSIASGRCINELKLLNDGYSITCSDLKIIPSYDASVKLFGTFPFLALDIIRKFPEKEYDCIICLSLIFNFNKDDLDNFFCHVNKGLSLNKYLVLDPGGGGDNCFSFFWDLLYLPIEYKMYSFISKIIGIPKKTLVDFNFGFRFTNKDIIESARRSGFEFVSLENFNFLDEFCRSILLRAIISRSSIAQRIFSILGRWNPYNRMFKFKKVSNKFPNL
jgi:hypothetical protein